MTLRRSSWDFRTTISGPIKKCSAQLFECVEKRKADCCYWTYVFWNIGYYKFEGPYLCCRWCWWWLRHVRNYISIDRRHLLFAFHPCYGIVVIVGYFITLTFDFRNIRRFHCYLKFAHRNFSNTKFGQLKEITKYTTNLTQRYLKNKLRNKIVLAQHFYV